MLEVQGIKVWLVLSHQLSWMSQYRAGASIIARVRSYLLLPLRRHPLQVAMHLLFRHPALPQCHEIDE